MNRQLRRLLLKAAATLLVVSIPQAVLAQSHNEPKDIAVEPLEARAKTGRRWAIIVTVDNYDHKDVPDLRYCGADGRLVAKVLTEECGYDPRDVVILHSTAQSESAQPRLSTICDELRFALRRAQPDDVVVVFFSGHGYLSTDGAGFLLPADFDPNRIEPTSLATAELRNWLADCKARQKLLVLDCCHAGGRDIFGAKSGEELGKAFRETPGLLTMASCGAGERSWEWPAKKQGVFTYHFVQGLRGDADAANDGFVDSAELFSYVRPKVIQTAEELGGEQTPVQIVGSGEVPVFILARVTPKVFFEDFSTAQPGLLPEGWNGNGLTVQELGAGQRALQLRDIGSGAVALPGQRIAAKDFYLECDFTTYGYINKPRGLAIALFDNQGNAIVRVSILDRYPRCDITVNNNQIQGRSLKYDQKNRLSILRKGATLQVKVNEETIHSLAAAQVDLPKVQLSLINNRDEYGRADQKQFPTIFAVGIGPVVDNKLK